MNDLGQKRKILQKYSIAIFIFFLFTIIEQNKTKNPNQNNDTKHNKRFQPFFLSA